MVNSLLLSELDQILQEDYDLKLPPPVLVEVADTLVSLFELLAKMELSTPKVNIPSPQT